MAHHERIATRRTVLTHSAGAALDILFQQVGELAIEAAGIGQVPTAPDDPAWVNATPTHVVVNPQNLALPRLTEAGATALEVRALYDDERVGLLLSWLDAHADTDLGTVMQFRDAVALQFPEDPTLATPSFMMGQAGGAVVIYHWKSDWQFGSEFDVDEAYPNMFADLYQFTGRAAGEMAEAMDYITSGNVAFLTAAAAGNPLADPQTQFAIGPVQKLRAEGFGTLEPDTTQDARGGAIWKDGSWHIVISLPRNQARFRFDLTDEVPVAFAAWDGSRNERNGQKAYSTWYSLRLGAPVVVPVEPIPRPAGSNNIRIPILSSAASAIVLVVAALIAGRTRLVRRLRKD